MPVPSAEPADEAEVGLGGPTTTYSEVVDGVGPQRLGPDAPSAFRHTGGVSTPL